MGKDSYLPDWMFYKALNRERINKAKIDFLRNISWGVVSTGGKNGYTLYLINTFDRGFTWWAYTLPMERFVIARSETGFMGPFKIDVDIED